MTRNTLKYFRTVIPGIIFAIYFFAPLFLIFNFESPDGMRIFKDFMISEPATVYKIMLGITIFFGLAYNMFDIRKRYMCESIDRIQKNIKERLLGLYASDPDIAPKADILKQGRTLLHVFYNLIDNDNSLIEKKENIYYNGCLMSTIADTRAISEIILILYFFLLLYAPNIIFALFWYIGIIISIIASLLYPKIVDRHIELSNEQLGFITIHYHSELREKLVSIDPLRVEHA